MSNDKLSLKDYVGMLDKESVAAIEYIELLNKDAELNALESQGVDNWEGWDDAFGDDYMEITYESHYRVNEI